VIAVGWLSFVCLNAVATVVLALREDGGDPR